MEEAYQTVIVAITVPETDGDLEVAETQVFRDSAVGEWGHILHTRWQPVQIKANLCANDGQWPPDKHGQCRFTRAILRDHATELLVKDLKHLANQLIALLRSTGGQEGGQIRSKGLFFFGCDDRPPFSFLLSLGRWLEQSEWTAGLVAELPDQSSLERSSRAPGCDESDDGGSLAIV